MRQLLLFIFFIMAACTQLKTQKGMDESQISDYARQKIEEARELIRDSKYKMAVSKLSEMKDDQLSAFEKALKYNLKGVTLFNLAEVDKALLNFQVADKYAPSGSQLYGQVQLNMASGHYKLNQFTEMKSALNKVDKGLLSELEKRKYAQLSLAYGKKFENNQLIVQSSLMLLGQYKNHVEIQSSEIWDLLKVSFKKLNSGPKREILESFGDSNNLAVALLAQQEADERSMSGNKREALDIISWLKSEFGENAEVRKFIKDFETRMENSSKISLSDIGLVLPLSGEKASYGQKALSGVDTGLRILGMNENIKIHTKDTADLPAQGAQAVIELIREERVAYIIGGLFPESAKAEYLEAKKYGVLYISLSQINLPKEEKNHRLIEIQGSIESQIEALLSEEMIKKFGSRLGIIYPDNEGGRAYVDEIWRKGTEKNLQITSLASFPKNTHDYRDTAQLFLGLKYPRERSEELAILENVYALEKTSIRRVQTLPPIIDFDWLFLASYPHEASQLIPTLGYYDASRLKIVGGPSWVSKSMVKEQKNLGTLYFVGDDPRDINQEMLTKYQEIYGRPASLIEIISMDAMKVGAEALLMAKDVDSRDEFDSRLKSSGRLKGLATEWKFKEDVWMKKMNPMTITRGDIVKLFGQDERE